MALARLSAIFILILYIKDSYGQQPGLGNKPGMGLTFGPIGCQQQAIQRKQGLISNPNILSQLSKPSSMGCSCNLKQQNGNLNVEQQGLEISNLQQTSNCQPSLQQQQSLQQSNNMLQFPNCQPSIQQQQNLQQSHFQSLPHNLQQQLLQQQQQILQQQQQQQILQQQQQQQTIPVTNLQIVGQQQPSVQTSDISFASLPIVNGQISSLPSQVSQGVLLSNLGLQSSLPSILPNSCDYKQQTEQIPMFVSQNSLSPVSIIDGSHSLPIPVTSSQPVEFTNTNNPPLSFMIPVTFQNNQATQQNEQTFDMPQNSVTFIQNQPQQNRVAFNPVKLQSQPVTSVQSQPVINPFPGKSSLLLSQIQSSNTTPQCSGPTAISSDSILNSHANNQQLQFLSLPIPFTSTRPVEFTNSNNPPSSFMIPVTFQNNQAAQQNEQTFDMGQNSATFIQSLPQQNLVAFNPVQLQSQPVTSMQSQPVTNPVLGEPSISSLLLSQMQSPNITPQCSGPTAISPKQSNNQGSKSSSIKALLPLLLSILKEKNSGCGCPQSCGPNINNSPPACGPITPNNNLNNNRNINCKEPQVCGGYSNLINYGRTNEDTSTNNIGSEESSESRKRKGYKKYKYQYDDSLESTEADDEYDVDSEY